MRSRGGSTSKIHSLTDQHTDPVIVLLTGSQADDNPALVPLLNAHQLRNGPARKVGIALLADKAPSHPRHGKRYAVEGTPSLGKAQIARRKAQGAADSHALTRLTSAG
ncbi:hypothetical protein D1871_02385 [Nakamurella silvestris]|nr:hypothetical protein D1871_02385 [Nakamurella silvestris]